jgi:mRNA-degrading endonuclease toxin of MazEF toxin-antitoxin module
VTAQRGEVWWVDLPPHGRRPAVIVSSNVVSRALGEVVAARVTAVERERSLGTHVRVESDETGLPERSFVLCHDLRTLGGDALEQQTGRLGPWRMAEVEQALRVALDLED